MQRRKGLYRTQRIQRTRSNRSRTHRSRTHRSRTHRSRTHRTKRIICNRTKRNRTKRRKGGNYDTDVTTQTRELVPMKSKDVVVTMPEHVLSAEDYVKHMEYRDFHGLD